MKKISRLKKAAPLILLGLLLDHSPVSPRAQALVGGPFDDNTFPGANADGTYSGTISGHNLTGIVSFGISSFSETNGRFSVFHEGFVHYGAATGIADLASRRVAGSLLGVAELNGPGAAGGGVTVNDSGSGLGTVNTGTGTLTVRTGVEGSFNARMTGYPRQIKFEGSGRLSSTANTAVVVKSTVAPDTGVLNAYTVFFPTNSGPQTQTDVPNPNSTTSGGGQVTGSNVQTQYSMLRTESPFKIRGSRTSRQPYTVVNNYTAITQTATISTPTVAITPIPFGNVVPTPVPNP